MRRDTWRGLRGFGHRPQYTAIKSQPGSSYHHDVPNRFARFKLFDQQVVRKGHKESNVGGCYMSPSEANAVIEAQPSATPITTPASTSLRKCMPSTMRDTAMLSARKKSTPSSDG